MLEESRDRLRDAVAALGTRRLVCMGNSAGVFGALYYGSELRADKVIVFSGPSSLQIGFEEAERQAYQRLHALRAEGKVVWPDLRAIYNSNAISVDFHFGSQNRVDRAQAENLAGLPNVNLIPFDTANHVLIDEMHRSGLFDRVLSDAASAKTSSPNALAQGNGGCDSSPGLGPRRIRKVRWSRKPADSLDLRFDAARA